MRLKPFFLQKLERTVKFSVTRDPPINSEPREELRQNDDHRAPGCVLVTGNNERVLSPALHV